MHRRWVLEKRVERKEKGGKGGLASEELRGRERVVGMSLARLFEAGWQDDDNDDDDGCNAR